MRKYDRGRMVAGMRLQEGAIAEIWLQGFGCGRMVAEVQLQEYGYGSTVAGA